ncbi:MAG TPA: RNA methyltransferase [Actinopolymorphaceae bacterium]
MRSQASPKDRFLTVYGFRPVLAALADEQLDIDKVIVAHDARGAAVKDVLRGAEARGIPVERATRHRVTLLSGNGRHDNGVLADVVAPRMRVLTDALAARPHERPETVLVLDGIKTPANIGMILRTATAAGVGGVIVPHKGTADLDPLVVKASAGVAFNASILRCTTPEEGVEQLVEAGYTIAGLSADGSTPLFDAELAAPVAFVLGSEGHGISPGVRPYVAEWVQIPMPGDVESLNVASAAAVVSFELVRRGLTAGAT